MWATIGQIALISFLVIAAGVVSVVFLRGILTRGLPDRRSGDGTQAYREAIGGPRPHAPRPEWAEDADDDPRATP